MKVEFALKPTIIVNICDNALLCSLNDLLLGIEEEELPFEIKVDQTIKTATQLAYEASVESSLLVGVGCDKDEIVLHYRNLEPANFVYKIKNYQKKSSHVLRALGSNAARLVKGNPFLICDELESSF